MYVRAVHLSQLVGRRLTVFNWIWTCTKRPKLDCPVINRKCCCHRLSAKIGCTGKPEFHDRYCTPLPLRRPVSVNTVGKVPPTDASSGGSRNQDDNNMVSSGPSRLGGRRQRRPPHREASNRLAQSPTTGFFVPFSPGVGRFALLFLF